ncbi:MAG: DUF349 domain-containing protein, partial [Prolixibacteraceae bacterium]|nr:DUF349 domain-containing protein [Prolixibacteraceae bacterium]
VDEKVEETLVEAPVASESTETPETEVLSDEVTEQDDDDDENHDDSNHDEEEDEPSPSHETMVDYSTFSEVELINEFRQLLETKSFMEIYRNVDLIKVNFYKKHKAKISEQKKTFLAEGGSETDFVPEADPYEQDLKNLLEEFRQKKANYNKDLEQEKDKNVQIKYEIIEEIKNLVNRKESINKTFQEFKELQQRWRDVGLVPQANMKDLWENYHHHVENFYDYIKINKELRDLDLKKNMEEKISLCEKAEELLLEPSVIKAFNTLQKLHDTWREVGPVPREQKEELWERFKEATTKINKKHQDFFENRKKAQKKNLEAKTALCEKVEEILTMNLESHKDWEDKSNELVELQKYWRTIGFTPKKENNIIYERFRVACDSFFDKKREFYSRHKEVQSNNLQMKIDLCVQAEALKDSNDWKKTTDEFIAIQKKWKEIGPIPRKHSDLVWKRFRAACDQFFESKSKFFNTKDESQLENLQLKKTLIDEVKSFKSSGNDEKDFEKLREFQRRWTEIGHVPIADKNNVQKQFRDAINVLFEKFSVEDRERNLLRFKSKMTDLKTSSRGHNKMYAERDKYVSKLKQLESDLITLKNNIGFFSNSKNAEALIRDVEQKIKNNEEQIVYLKEKIRVIDDVDYSEE